MKKPLFLYKTFKPEHNKNLMKHEGDVQKAREYFYNGAPDNLLLLLENRYNWMNEFIKPEHTGVEVGCGSGVSKEFINCSNYKVTDYAEYDWLDVKNVDALNLPFDNESLNFVVSSNMIHHVPFPTKFFNEVSRVLKPGGYVLIQEINASFMMRVVLNLMKHEGYSYEIDPFVNETVATDINDLWSANCAIPNLLFDNARLFETQINDFKIIKNDFDEFFCFLNSGGVIAKTFYIPLFKWQIKVLQKIDLFLTSNFPSLFALQRKIVLRKNER